MDIQRVVEAVQAAIKQAGDDGSFEAIVERGAFGDRIVRPAEACHILGVSRPTLWRMQKRGEIPPPLQISKGAVGWKLSTLSNLIAQREQEAAARAAVA